MNSDFTNIIKTAAGVAKSRATFTQIPYSKQIAEIVCEKEGALKSGLKEIAHWMLPSLFNNGAYLELRYYSINNVLRQRGYSCVLELAAGFSPRGLGLTREGVMYIETDLQEVIKQKADIVGRIRRHEEPVSGKHYFAPLDLCNSNGMGKIIDFIKSKRVVEKLAIVLEGFLEYLNLERQKQARENISKILKEFPESAWITTDLATSEFNGGFFLGIRDWKDKRRVGETNPFLDINQVSEFLRGGSLVGERFEDDSVLQMISKRAKKGMSLHTLEQMAYHHKPYILRLR